MIIEDLLLHETQYYKVICQVSEKIPMRKWLARVRVLRRDTGEYIKMGFTLYESDKKLLMETVIEKINASLLVELEQLGIPTDWNCKVRRIVALCKVLHSEILSFSECLGDRSALMEDEVLGKYFEFWKRIIKQSAFLGVEVKNLTPLEKLDLLAIQDFTLIDPSDHWSLGEIDARLMAFDFFVDPTDEEKALHELQRKKLTDRFIDLGWN